MKTYAISGMTCDNCVRHVTEAIESVRGVTNVHVDLVGQQAQVHGEVSDSAIAEAVSEAGYEVRV